MRLTEPPSSPADAVNHVMEQSSAGKRARPTSVSSLDYQARQAAQGKLLTPKPKERKSPQHQQQNEEEQYVQPRRSASRARGGSGPPPRNDYIDPRALYELYGDTEQSSSAKASQSSGGGPAGAPTGAKKAKDRYYRTPDGRAKDSNEYPDYLREQMDKGVPVTQWVVLLLLL